MSGSMDWMSDGDKVGEKWGRLDQLLADFERSRLCFELYCLKKSAKAIRVESGTRRFEAGFCMEHADLVSKAGLGSDWKLGSMRELAEDEILDGPGPY